MKMHKPSRTSVKNAAIAVGLLGGIAISTVLSLKAVHTYYGAKIDLNAHKYLIAKMYEANPEFVMQQAVEADAVINAVLSNSK